MKRIRNFCVHLGEDGSFSTSATQLRAPVRYDEEPRVPLQPVKRIAVASIFETELGLPVSKIPKVGPRKWGDVDVQEKHKVRAQEIIVLGAPTASQDISVYRAFSRWRWQQGMSGVKLGQVLCVFGAYLEAAELKHSTIVTYVISVDKMAARDGEKRNDQGEFQAFLKGMKLLAANDVPDHAMDVSAERIAEILRTVRKEKIRFAIWMITTIGARCRDLRRLTKRQIELVGSCSIKIHFKVTKTARDSSEGYEVKVEFHAFAPFEAQWSQFLEEETPFNIKADQINKTLHAAGFPETSYSFRRFFIQATVDRFTNDNHTDWCRVIEITGHQQAKIVKSTYVKTVEDRKSPVPVKSYGGIPSTSTKPKAKIQLSLDAMFKKK